MSHDELVKAANEALQKVFGDTSVDRETTRASLVSLKGNVDMMIDILDI